MKNVILITTGDADGIGLEVTIKTLLSYKSLPKEAQLIFFRSAKADSFAKGLIKKLQKRFSLQTCQTLAEALLAAKELKNKKSLIEIVSTDSPAHWVEQSASACLNKSAQALVTAPLSKQLIAGAGFSDLGHTDILKRICKVKTAFMGFVGRHFNVVLITGHIPVTQVESRLNEDLFYQAALAGQQLQQSLSQRGKPRPIGVVGLNPHAGDDGLIGEFDKTHLRTFIAATKAKGLNIQGPLVPDACFQKENWNKYSLYLCCYHDQGLIPFKMAHGQESGVHITLGLPIIRTSVDHGTAKDIYGKNKAKPHSMKEALQMALKLSSLAK